MGGAIQTAAYTIDSCLLLTCHYPVLLLVIFELLLVNVTRVAIRSVAAYVISVDVIIKILAHHFLTAEFDVPIHILWIISAHENLWLVQFLYEGMIL